MAADLGALCADLAEEQRVLTERVRDLPEPDWRRATPAPGWTVGDAISHLCFFSELGALAVADPDRFLAERTVVADESPRPDLALADLGPAALCDRWRDATGRLVAAVGTAPARVPWYGPPMSPASFVTARIMETWAHGQDVADALGLPPVVSARLRHVCHLGVITRGWAYSVRGLPVPAAPVAVRLRGPGGEPWSWGEESGERVEGPALDFALVVTRRRPVAGTALRVEGDAAREWMEIAQAYAGSPGPGRASA